MRKTLAMGFMLTIGFVVGCQKNQTTVRPVPMPLSSASDASHPMPQHKSFEDQPVGISTGPASPGPMTANNGYVASAQSPYIELPAVSVSKQTLSGEVIEPRVEGFVSSEPAEPLTNMAPSTYTSKTDQQVAPTPAYEPAPPQVVAPEPVTASGASVHVVSKGDTLWRIAKKYYGSGKRWVDIANANGLSDPNRIYVGMQLTIPR